MVLTNLNSEDEYTKAKNDKKLTVIDYYADWCGPCKLLMPIVEKVSEEYGSEVNFYKFDTQEHFEAVDNEDLPGLPVVRFYKNGEMVHQIYGNNLDEMVEVIKKYK